MRKKKTNVPQANDIASLEKKGLAKTGDLAFPLNGDHIEMNKYIEGLIPRPFQYLRDNDLACTDGQLDWRLLTWRNRRLELFDSEKPTGRNFQSAKSRDGAGALESKIFVGAYIQIVFITYADSINKALRVNITDNVIDGWAEVQSAVSDLDENTPDNDRTSEDDQDINADTSGRDEFDKKAVANKVDAGENSEDSGDETDASQPILDTKSIKEIKTMVAAAKLRSKFG